MPIEQDHEYGGHHDGHAYDPRDWPGGAILYNDIRLVLHISHLLERFSPRADND